jgi:hypothetical protein
MPAERSHVGQRTPSGQRSCRTVAKHCVSSMRDCIGSMTPVSPRGCASTSAPSRRATLTGREPVNSLESELSPGFFGTACHPTNRLHAHHSCLASRLSPPPMLYTARGCGHGGTRNISTLWSVHTCPEVVCQGFFTCFLPCLTIAPCSGAAVIPDAVTRPARSTHGRVGGFANRATRAASL